VEAKEEAWLYIYDRWLIGTSGRRHRSLAELRYFKSNTVVHAVMWGKQAG